jgi:23S rRNA pseudouridine1911/1915/1917 synthase
MFAEKRKYQISAELAGKRVDAVLAILESDVSRQYLQKLLKDKRVWSGKHYLKPSYKVEEGEEITVDFPAAVKMEILPVALPMDIVYEDEYLLVINKAPGVVVHPAEHGKFMGKSLVNAVLAHVGDGLKGIGGVLRPGIVHRLDKDTSGLIVVAKTDLAHQGLIELFKSRQIEKKYQALVWGNLTQDKGRIEGAIGRNEYNRKKMAIDGIQAREAVTEFEVLKRYKNDMGSFSLVDIHLLTGRTHQIRVHFQSIRHALIGDQTYGNARVNQVFERKFQLTRQFLHAYALAFVHPITKKKVDLKVGLPEDLEKVLKGLSKSEL